MTLELKLILGFLFHLVGDYLFQNHRMANEKTKSTSMAVAHGCSYSILFLVFSLTNFVGFLIILISHILIDRFRLVKYWIALINGNIRNKKALQVNNGFPEGIPPFLSVFLVIVIDNTFHLLINSACIIFLPS